ncbi:MAG: Orotidine 5'-phosphate decarboxylase [Candidatus Beckwithbacteria bacterium GW2011_GWB1_47_15]|uniref:Orotidine-5'-phosphate decarboxylase n=1 Tax=Candidatus Beckwithbacteria bacterium GW2011_GWB1_47_15 TaxID=1618371 RepID=A0A0G1RWF8_9BACT|nr:MAG: orotidine 5'-phosphate decarboxylase, orotidine-5'-phosphate decarboxylase [Candidatus Beckwithbacteria bacterium GW2011_GWC1_49_16]KKU35366.1 MAG: Orotidine 5'-phosphate decarboxylase [Candidatus Beckwithbacteria bacterium GW2011_GWA1_46_30]KKU61461.1 MAG: Orotidine 5'-phosphate decarboxylase [Candidatus Beckwithbacteria bacterium GW2011_GWB1_47_15]KKU71868.1 MAG: Orotidine 5'-phosphate decarboxylase [Candidatus Beckwithbacteria bacterium GW2011_GWA2_47_25]KKW03763.1 MAG: Orotidine 5'-
MRFQQKLSAIQKKNNSLVCVGLDQGEFEFDKKIIEKTHDLVCAYKPNFSFYEARGETGWRDLKLTAEYLRKNYPEVVTIADAKRADIGNSNQGYVKAIFDELKFDAVTVHPYLGREAVLPFLERADKGIFVLCRTSNPGAGEFQDLKVGSAAGSGQKPLWQAVTEGVRDDWNENGNVMLVAGATYPEELKKIREVVGEMTLLVPGVGAQGGDVAKTVKAGVNSRGAGMIVNSSRGIIFADDPRTAAEKLRDEINSFR